MMALLSWSVNMYGLMESCREELPIWERPGLEPETGRVWFWTILWVNILERLGAVSTFSVKLGMVCSVE